MRPSTTPQIEDCLRGYDELIGIVDGITFSGSDGDRVRDAHNWVIGHARYDTLSDECGN